MFSRDRHSRRWTPRMFLVWGLVPWVCWGQGEDEFAPRHHGFFLVNQTYVVDFDVQSGIAHWVHYELTAAECVGSVPRDDAFSADGRIVGSPDHNAYRNSGYDRGHLKPAADSKESLEVMRNSFLMTNMAPQTPNLNRGIWKELEEAVRGWAWSYGEVHVTCGPGRQTYDWLDSGVRVPEEFWKVVMRVAPDTACLAFVFPNAEKVDGNLSDYLVSVDALEARLGLDLLPGLPDVTEKRVEAAEASGFWSRATGDPAALPNSQGTSPLAPSEHAAVQCMGMAKSTGKRCQIQTKDPSGYCRYHKKVP
ncbi:MAG: DNA/RNA non-specific endonuclease [Bacteroidetes bacterium]|nr:DNA/RNA non-specific endonuclease [Bacteroidota bacterium]MDA0904250.1 DNA/RNA non-specific endonuclease [Bacteroidota bacterium]